MAYKKNPLTDLQLSVDIVVEMIEDLQAENEKMLEVLKAVDYELVNCDEDNWRDCIAQAQRELSQFV